MGSPVVLILFSTILLYGRVCCQGTTPETPNKAILPPPPPPPPNPPQNFQRDDDETKVTEPPVTKDPQEPIPELIETGGKELIVNIEFKSFDAMEQEGFQIAISNICNDYCKTKGNCEGDFKIVGGNDVVVYNIDAAKTDRTAVSFYIKNPDARTMLAMTTEQIDKMVLQERAALETALGYKIDLGDLDGFQPYTNGLLLESWVIALLSFIGLCLLFGAFVAFVHFRNKKRDTKLTFDDLELQASSVPVKVLPMDPPTSGSNSLKKTMVDSSTNVYQSEILAETKSVFIKDKPSGKKDVDSADNENQYAVIDDKHEQNKEEHVDEPPASPNAIVVTAEIASSSSNDSSSEGEPPSPSNVMKPPDYEEVAIDGKMVTKSLTNEPVNDEDLPPPPPPEDDSPAASSDDLPPPPPEQETKELKDEESLESSMKEEAEVVGELENLIADQSKNESAKQGLDNAGYDTVVGDNGQPSTEL